MLLGSFRCRKSDFLPADMIISINVLKDSWLYPLLPLEGDRGQIIAAQTGTDHSAASFNPCHVSLPGFFIIPVIWRWNGELYAHSCSFKERISFFLLLLWSTPLWLALRCQISPLEKPQWRISTGGETSLVRVRDEKEAVEAVGAGKAACSLTIITKWVWIIQKHGVPFSLPSCRY